MREIRKLRWALVVGLIAGLAVTGGSAIASPTAHATQKAAVPVPAAFAAAVRRSEAAGWHLTDLGKAIAAGLPVVHGSATGSALIATTSDSSLAADAAQPASTASGVRSLASAKRKTLAKATCSHRQRSLAASAGTGFICNWGQEGDVFWDSGSGGAYAQFIERDAGFNNSTVNTFNYCTDVGCKWLSWDDPDANHEVTFVTVENAWYATIEYAYCN